MRQGWRPGRLQTAELAVVAIAAALALAPLPASRVESWYSTSFYPHVQRVLTPISNTVPFAFLDVLLLALVAVVVASLARSIRQAWTTRRLARLARTVWHLLSAAAALYVLFLLLWGFNYRRVRMPERLVLDKSAPTAEAVVQLGLTAIAQINSLYDAAHAQRDRVPEWRDQSLRRAFDDVQRTLSLAPTAAPGRLKRTLIGPYFRWTGVDGMVNPFGLEVIANPDLLSIERPFVASHEWAHLAGFADESEANFVGWLTCIRALPAHQYSGWLYLYWQINGEVNNQERTRLTAALAEGPRRDITAIVARLRRGEIPALQRASWQVYDSYLKANRVESGLRSYGEVVTLVLRARFDPGWVPVRRALPVPPSPAR